ncbi:hypothetical protein [Azohydromonas aeria]|uniref:hypothetical protein n=1 Tax=Azohydromonas aeria TaxID=2590212 RepID=UPI0012FC24D4|nr:hypothetical protein [Azohydromonas aeria]
MRISDFVPLRPMPGAGPAAPARSAAGTQASPAAWLDAALHEDAAIVADPGAAPRAWSVERHAARVLQALCGEPGGAP